MRLLYVDIDSLRPDHLGCYGYARPTSPHIDRIARTGVRYGNCYAPDVPCLPSRTSLFSGRFGIHHGAVNHGGTRAEPFGDGTERGFRPSLARTSWPAILREAGYRTATISSFADRHGAWHFHAGFDEAVDPGGRGHESAEDVTPIALDWIARNGAEDRWFLHVNYWDVHVPHRAPAEFRAPFAGPRQPEWLTEELLREHWSRPGLRSAQDPTTLSHPGQPVPFDALDKVHALYDNYDAAVRCADHHVGLLLDALQRRGVLRETAVIVGADHGECLGELNCYGGHCLADHNVCHVPMIVRLPGVTDGCGGGSDDRLCHPFDVTAAVSAALGARIPACWDARPLPGFASGPRQPATAGPWAMPGGRGPCPPRRIASASGETRRGGPAADQDEEPRPAGAEPGRPGGRQAVREFLVVSQLAQTAQRSVRFDREGRNWLFIRTWHDGLNALPERMLFDLTGDPHELHDRAGERPDLVEAGERMLAQWTDEMLAGSPTADPLQTVLREQPEGCRGRLESYADRLRQTGRARWADELLRRHGPVQETDRAEAGA